MERRIGDCDGNSVCMVPDSLGADVVNEVQQFARMRAAMNAIATDPRVPHWIYVIADNALVSQAPLHQDRNESKHKHRRSSKP